MTVKELIEELQVYVDIGYGWMDVEGDERQPIKVFLTSDDSPKLILKE